MRVEVLDKSRKPGEMVVKSINLKRYAIPFNTPFDCDPVLYNYLTEHVPYQARVETENEMFFETRYRPRCHVSLIQE